MRAGPKGTHTEPLDLSGLPEGGGARVVAFVEEFCRLPKGAGARRPLVLPPWQRDFAAGCFDEPRPRRALLSVARKNGKSVLAAALALYALVADGEEGAEVLVASASERQSRIVFDLARRMVQLDERLAAHVQVFADRLYVPSSDSTLEPLPALADKLQGRNPSLAVVDELHVVGEDVWDAMSLAGSARERPLVLAISTAAASQDSVMWTLTKLGREGTDPAFHFAEFTAPPGCALDDEDAWAQANPALDDYLDREHLRAALRVTREVPWRRFVLNQHVGQVDAWLAPGLWDACADPGRVVEASERVVLGFDGSASGDSTALVGCTVAEPRHLFVVGLWQNPGDPRWRVPRAEVDAAVAAAFESFDVGELAADPWGWRSELEAWDARHGRVIEWPTNVVSRMGPATDRAYAAIVDRHVSHDGDPRLARHVGNCVAKSTPAGDVITKATKNSPHKIDAAVAAIVAHDRAAWHAGRTAKRRGFARF